MVADHVVLVVALSTWSLGDNTSPIHVVIVHNSEVNLDVSRIENYAIRTFPKTMTSTMTI